MSRCLKTGPFSIGGTFQRTFNRHAALMQKRIRCIAVWCDGRMLQATSCGSRTAGGQLLRKLKKLNPGARARMF